MSHQTTHEASKSKEKNPYIPKNLTSPLTRANCVSKYVFAWLTEAIRLSGKTPWTQEMSYDLEEYDESTTYKKAFLERFRRNKSVLSSVLWAQYTQVLLILFFTVLRQTGSILKLKYQSDIIGAIKANDIYKNEDNLKDLIILICLFLLSELLRESTHYYYQFIAARSSLTMRSSILSILQDKILKFSPLNSRLIDQGFITNLLQVDSTQVNELMPTLSQIAESMTEILVKGSLLLYSAGLKFSITYILGILVLLLPYILVFWCQSRVQNSYLKAKDSRMSLFKNVVENIEYVKINGLEQYFCLEIWERREREIHFMRINALIEGIFSFLVGLNGIGPAGLCIIVIVLYKPAFDFQQFIFVTELASNFGFAVVKFVTFAPVMINVLVSLRRIGTFLESREMDQGFLKIKYDPGSKLAISVQGTFKWKYSEVEELLGIEAPNVVRKDTILGPRLANPGSVRDSKNESSSLLLNINDLTMLDSDNPDDDTPKDQYFVRDLNLKILKGEIIMIIGKSSSGKSSLLYSMLGEMLPVGDDARVSRNGDVSYMGQTRWMLGGTIKENICLGFDYDEDHMQRCLEASQLIQDMDSLEYGIETILGDNGDTVSGGQRARIALARCFYQK